MAEKQKVVIGNEGISDVSKLGVGKTLVLGFQHMFAI